MRGCLAGAARGLTLSLPRQYIDPAQADPLAVGAAPSGDQIVAGHGRVAAGLAAGDVVEVRAVARTHAKRVEIGVDETDGRVSVGHQLLVDQGNVAGPHRCGKAGAAILVGRAGGLVSADVEGEVRVGRDIRAVAIGGRALVAGVDHARELLPRGESRSCPARCRRRYPTQAVSDFQAPPALAVVRSVPPTETILASSAGQASFLFDQVEAVARRREEVLALRRHLLEVGSSVLGSAGVQPHEQPMVVGSGLCVVMALMMAVSVEPTYMTRLASPGAMPMAWVMSSVCSVSSHRRRLWYPRNWCWCRRWRAR
jgi:hypothetical protein